MSLWNFFRRNPQPGRDWSVTLPTTATTNQFNKYLEEKHIMGQDEMEQDALESAKGVKEGLLGDLKYYMDLLAGLGDFETAARCRDAMECISTGIQSFALGHQQVIKERDFLIARVSEHNVEIEKLGNAIHELEEMVSNAEERATLAFNESRKRGERIYELEAEVENLKLLRQDDLTDYESLLADAERLRKALQHIAEGRGNPGFVARAALSPSPAAASGENNWIEQISSTMGDIEKELKSKPTSAPAAGSADYDRGVECEHE